MKAMVITAVSQKNRNFDCTCQFGNKKLNLCVAVLVPVAPPVDVPVSPVSDPVAAPVAQNTSDITATPPGPKIEVIVPAIVVPVCAAMGVSIFLIVFFVNKRKKNKGDSKKDDSDDTQPMAQLTPTAYADVPSTGGDGRVYRNMPNEQENNSVQRIDPNGIKPNEIEARMHIPYKSLVFLKEIGAGSYGKVFLG